MLGQVNRRRDILVSVLAVCFGTAVLGVLLVISGWPQFGSPYTIRALLPEASTLAPGARVTMAGVQVGRVSGVQLRGVDALVSLQITDHAVTPLPADSRVQLRERTPVGENYISITRGRSSRMLASGALLPVTQADPFVDVDQILSVLQGVTQKRTRQLIQSFGGALDGRGTQLNDLLGDVTPIMYHGGRLATLLDGEREQVAQLVAQLGDVSAAIGSRDAAISELARDGLATFTDIAERDDALRQFLDQLPATLTQVRTTTDTLAAVTVRAAPVVTNLAGVVTALRPAVQNLAPASDIGRTALNELSAATPNLRNTLAAVHTLSAPATRVLPALHHVLCQVNPMLRYSVPYVPDLNSMITNMEDAGQGWDNIGHIVRVSLDVSEGSLGALPPNVEAAADELVHSGLLSVFPDYSFDPYPPPGVMKTQSALNTPHYTGRADFGAHSGYRYPHITADC